VIRLGLLGRKLGHSHSPALFKDIFRKNQINNYSYELFELADLRLFKQWLIETRAAGFNVTIPYKKEIIPFLDNVSPEAESVNAVNCVKVEYKLDGSVFLSGFNTDIAGVKASISSFPESVKSGKTIVLGNGGASLAVQYVLKTLSMPFVVVSRFPTASFHLGWNMVDDIDWDGVSLLINTTSLGMYPDISSYPPLPYSQIHSHTVCWDLIYNPEFTVFLERCKARGCKTENGSQMLRVQAAEAWNIWQQTN
jgi:shikimate dehydrogenase